MITIVVFNISVFLAGISYIFAGEKLLGLSWLTSSMILFFHNLTTLRLEVERGRIDGLIERVIANEVFMLKNSELDEKSYQSVHDMAQSTSKLAQHTSEQLEALLPLLPKGGVKLIPFNIVPNSLTDALNKAIDEEIVEEASAKCPTT